MIGSLLYLTTYKLDIMVSVCILRARFYSNCKEKNITVVKGIIFISLKYIQFKFMVSKTLWFLYFIKIIYRKCDVTVAINVTKNRKHHKTTKYIEIIHHFVQDIHIGQIIYENSQLDDNELRKEYGMEIKSYASNFSWLMKRKNLRG